jgi:phospholipase C
MRRRDLGLVPLLSRREALWGAAAALASACTGPDRGAGDGAAPVEPATIDTIVVLMMENRSFDHFLGSLSLAEGRADVDGLDDTMSNPDADGVEHPVAPATVDCLADPPHSWSRSHDQFDAGANDGFVRAYASAQDDPSVGPEVMGYFGRAALPITYALADAYTVCDAWFCSVMGPTWPNRLYAHAGTSDGQDDNAFPDGGAFTFPTVWTKLDEVGVPWRYYYVDVPFLGLFANHLRDGTYGYLEDFFSDAARGELPPVVWIDPGFTFNDDHPPHHPGLGQELIASIYTALAASPQWGRCLFILMYDEHGGFFDHVAPPVTADDHARQGFDQLGFRVPALLVGPYVRPGVEHTPFDHTSWIKYVCERFGITPWTARIDAATSIAVALDTDRMAAAAAAAPIVLPPWDLDDSALGPECEYGAGGAGFAPTTEIETFVRGHMPHLDRSGDIARVLAAIRAVRGA